ncbi:hypothetical protein [Agrobacterium fabrum]|uniref:hypothetical protein n=1 Tax=Agrobacterium fabrum TaxID=1176649 RepID=UPI003CCF0372
MATRYDDGARYVLRISTDPVLQTKKRSSSRISPGISSPRMKHCRTALSLVLCAMGSEIRNSAFQLEHRTQFEISEALPKTPLPAGLPAMLPRKPATPRLWLNSEQLSAFADAVAKDPKPLWLGEFYEKSVEPCSSGRSCRNRSPIPTTRVSPRSGGRCYRLPEVIYAIRHWPFAGACSDATTFSMHPANGCWPSPPGTRKVRPHAL